MAEADVIAGLSVPDPSKPPPEHSYFVVYLDGKPAASDYFSAFPLVQGYNLMELHYDFGIDPLPLTTSIAIPITDSPALDIYACQAAFQDVGYFKRSCGIDPYGGTWQAQGSLFSADANSSLVLSLNDAGGNVADASITMDGTPLTYDDNGQTYSFYPTGSLQGAHTLTFSVPNAASETLSLTPPGPVTLSAPTDGQALVSGATVPISWSAAAGTACYDIYFLADNANGDWLYHTITSATSVVTPAITYSGPAHLTVKAIGALAVGSQGLFITPVSQQRIAVTFH